MQTGITYSQKFMLWEAAVAAGLDLERMERGEYSPRFLETVIAWWNCHGAYELHVQDAVNRKRK